MRLGAAGNSSTEYGYTKICTIKKQGAKIPLLKVLAVKGLLSRSPLQGSGQRPEVLGLGTESQGLPHRTLSTKGEEKGKKMICKKRIDN